MDVVRKIIGLFIILFIGLPVLFGIIVAVGMTQAVTSPDLYSKMPREIIARVPDLADDLVYSSRQNASLDSNSRAWLQAMAAVETKPHQVLASSGLLDWMDGELTQSLDQIGKMFRGEMPLGPVRLDLRPLKQALQHESVGRYLGEVLAKLPACPEADARIWEEIVREERHHGDLPACRPIPEISGQIVAQMQREMVRDIPDQTQFMDVDHDVPRPFTMGAVRTVVSATYLLFLIPAVFIGLGALVAAGSRRSFLRWFGVSTGIGGLIGLGFGMVIDRLLPMALYSSEFHYDGTWLQLRDATLARVSDLLSIIGRNLFSPVISVAEVVCIVGLVVFALSYLVNDTRRSPAAQPPVPPAA